MSKPSVQFSTRINDSVVEISSVDENIHQLHLSVKTGESENRITFRNKDKVIELSDKLRDLAEKMTSVAQPAYRITGKAIMVLSHNLTKMGTLIDCDEVNRTLFHGDVQYETLYDAWMATHPDNTDNHMVFVLYNLMDGSIGREVIENSILACIRYQSDFVSTYNFHTCKFMGLPDVVAFASETTKTFEVSQLSRATTNVLILTRQGNITLDRNNGDPDTPSLFDSGANKLDGTKVSRYEVVERIREIIEKEDKSHPYCDEAITAILKRENYDIARRTVQKYRESFLKIEISNKRKVKY